MVYNMEILPLFLLCLSVLYNNRIEGKSLVEVEDGENKPMHAGYFTLSERFEGTRARISVWDIPEVHSNSESAVFIAVLNEKNGPGPGNSMVAGFHVRPSFYYGSIDLRLFVGWMIGNDACYSITCQGFVVSNVSGAPVPGAIPQPLSTYNGEDHFVTLSIKKDEKTQDWSLYRDDDNKPILIGWWPKTLFNNTFDYATKLAWVGGVFYPNNETSPPMGSGHFAVEGAHKAAYISHIKIFNQYGEAKDPYIGRELADGCVWIGVGRREEGKKYWEVCNFVKSLDCL